MSINFVCSVTMAFLAVIDVMKGNRETAMLCVIIALQLLILDYICGRKKE